MAEDNYTRITLRIPKDLVQQVNRAAFSTSKSQNAEIIARLRSSFELDKSLPTDVRQAIEHEMEERGGTAEEAHVRLAHAAMANGGTLFHATITPETTLAQFHKMLAASKTVIPPDASIVFERKPVKGSR